MIYKLGMRSLITSVERDLRKKFVFLAGPRQVGKTYLAKEILKKTTGQYYNWDLAEDRQIILSHGFIHDQFAVLDELHKYDRWKNLIKGVYDKFHETLKILVTGSARLDIYRRGGDSLVGRYFLFHLHPLTLGEIYHPTKIKPPDHILQLDQSKGESESFENLMKWGGFPEPFYSGSEEAHRRWSMQRLELLVHEDIRDLTNVNMLSLMEHLILLLPTRVGSTLSINNLKQDLQVAYNTVRSWLDILERLYIIFTLKPFTAKLARAVHKERKVYLWDWSQVIDEGARFENFVASHLWKAVQIWRDLGMGDFELCFLRDRDRREVDFCITKSHQPWLLVEAKLSQTAVSESLDYFANRLRVPALQVISSKNVDKKIGSVRILSADRWLLNLP